VPQAGIGFDSERNAVTIITAAGERTIAVSALYQDDGIDHLSKRPHAVVTALLLPPGRGLRTAYSKLRRRGSIDFPIAGAAVAMQMDGDHVVWARIVLSAVGSRPVDSAAAEVSPPACP